MDDNIHANYFYYKENKFFSKSDHFTHHKKYTIIKDGEDKYYVVSDDMGKVHDISLWFFKEYFITHREMIIQKILN